MGLIHRVGSRRSWSTAFGAAFLAAVLLFVPISYQKTVGHDVTVGVSGPAVSAESVAALGDEFRTALDTDRFMIRPTADGGYTLSARIDERNSGAVDESLAGFTAALASRGFRTDTSVQPVVESVRGNVYLAAANSLITLRVEGRSADEVADDLRYQLEDAGVYDADVQVDFSGGCRKIMVHAGDGSAGDLPEIQCETDGGLCRALKIHRTPGMTDAELIEEIERQLADQGLTADVSIGADGYPEIEFLGGCD